MKSGVIFFTEPFAEAFPFGIEDITPGPDARRAGWIAGLGRAIDFAEGGLGFRLLPRSLNGVEVIAPGVRAKSMRIGPGHLFGLPEIKSERMAGFGKVVGATERPAIGARGDQGAEFAAQRVVTATIQMHGRKIRN